MEHDIPACQSSLTIDVAAPAAGRDERLQGAVACRIDGALERAVAGSQAYGAPPQFAQAIRHAVFPGGARIRPKLVLAVADACGEDDPRLTDAAAAAIELLHCASLVHDDLPCFDDAATRRGVPSVHRAYGERLAVLTGDVLIVLAFQTVADAGTGAPARLAPLVATLSRGVGPPSGIAAGQAWECEPQADLAQYHAQKTGALFAAATMAGAQSAGAAAAPWRAFGEALGAAYQAADDIRDVCAEADWLGKPTGRDVAFGRPSIVRAFGLAEAMARFQALIEAAGAAIPDVRHAARLRLLVQRESERLVPSDWLARAEQAAA